MLIRILNTDTRIKKRQNELKQFFMYELQNVIDTGISHL